MYQLILLILIVVKGELAVHQINLENFDTLSECQGFKIAVEDKIVLKLTPNTTHAAMVFECRQNI